jgi:hypothetical protein
LDFASNYWDARGLERDGFADQILVAGSGHIAET